MPEICVAHLVRAKNGVEPFKAFLKSYQEHRAGVEHDFLVVFKGFADDQRLDDYYALLEGLSYKSTFVPDRGFDIGSYFTVARRFDYRYFCFLNSYSIILAEDWVRNLYVCLCHKDVGLVGATGSYGSSYSHTLHVNGYKTVYTHLLTGYGAGNKYRLLGIRNRVFVAICTAILDKIQLLRFSASYDPFPAYHIRTNAFMIPREYMLRIRYKKIRNKRDAYIFESGKNSLTNQILRMNLRVLVVGRNGKCYDKRDWDRSDTFWQGDQNNLLIADNQTNAYSCGDLERRQFLSGFAWGDQANPTLK